MQKLFLPSIIITAVLSFVTMMMYVGTPPTCFGTPDLDLHQEMANLDASNFCWMKNMFSVAVAIIFIESVFLALLYFKKRTSINKS